MNANSTSIARHLQLRRRTLMLIGAVAIAVIWSVVLAGPDTPGADSPEAGYTAALALHARQLVATVDLVANADDPQDGAAFEKLEDLDTIGAAHAELADRADVVLADWGVEPDELGSNPVAWMGHVPPGQIPGSIDRDDLAALSTSRQVIAEATAAMVASADGAMLMARAATDLVDVAAVEALAAADLSLDRRLQDLAQSLRTDVGLAPVAVVSAMTTDPGELDQGGNPVDSIGVAVDGALRLAPFLVAVGLVVASLIGMPERRRGAVAIAAGVASLVAGFLHSGLIGPHFDEAPISGAFFLVVAAAQAGLGVALLASPNRELLRTSAGVSGAVTVIYAIFRLISPPGLVGPATVDLTGVVIVALQLVVVAAWVLDGTTDSRSRLLQG